MPTRRVLLKSLMAVPFSATISSVNGRSGDIAAGAELKVGKFLMFADPQALDISGLSNSAWPEGWNFDMKIVPVRLGQGQTVEDVVRIYRLDEK